MSNRSAAGLRRSAIVARIRLREEWSELKGPEEGNPKKPDQIPEIIKKHQKPVRSASKLVSQKIKYTKRDLQKRSPKVVLRDQTNAKQKSKNVSKSNATRESMINSHRNIVNSSIDILRGVVALVEVGEETRALALRAALMAMGATVLPTWSPLVTHLIWSEGGCREHRARARALGCRVASPLWVEACAGAARRAPEAAFPAAARASDLPSPRALAVLLERAEAMNVPLSHLLTKDNERQPRLRISDTDHDSSADQSTERTDTSLDKSGDATDPEANVNTLPRAGEARSRRKLFTNKEARDLSSADEAETPAPTKQSGPASLSRPARRGLARAERMARRLLGAPAPPPEPGAPSVVLTGMSRSERQLVQSAVRSIGGRLHKHVTARTTHVVLGSCRHTDRINPDTTGIHPLTDTLTKTSANRPERVDSESVKARTLNALLGGARGCRILHAQWVTDSAAAGRWLHHHGYEVHHLKKISQKARVERAALGRTCSEYAYDVFNGMKVHVSPHAEQRDAAIQLLTLCGGVVQNGGHRQDGGDPQDGGERTADCDVRLGSGEGEVSSKWVFDSVAAGRMRTTRRYFNGFADGNR